MLIRRELFGCVDPKQNNNIEKQEINVSCDPFKQVLFFRWKKRRCSWGSLRRVSSASISFTWKIWNRQSKVHQVLLPSHQPFVLLTIIWSDAVSDWKQKKQKRSQAVSLQSYKGLAEVAIRCICDLLVALPHFNFPQQHRSHGGASDEHLRQEGQSARHVCWKHSTFGDVLIV